tara:strand:+ start:207 stop:656 length:450 start_codon:yes stop_codon:yes gene_type:complete
MRNLAIKYGIGIALTLVAYFLLLKIIGLHNYPVLSAFNGVIYGAGILMALKRFKAESESFNFLNGFQLGLFTGAIATVLFSFFMALYIFQIDTEFALAILDSWGLNYNKGGLIIIVSLVMMGFSTTLVLTLAFMQLLKESWNTSKQVLK